MANKTFSFAVPAGRGARDWIHYFGRNCWGGTNQYKRR